MKLSPHFTLEELTVSQAASRLDLDNSPDAFVLAALTHTAKCMEEVRTALGAKPIYVSSGYRSIAVNKAVGGAVTSQHTKGEAVDFVCPAYGAPTAIVARLRDKIDYDQCILEYGDSGWVHISFRRSGNRKQTLVVDSKGTRPYDAK